MIPDEFYSSINNQLKVFETYQAQIPISYAPDASAVFREVKSSLLGKDNGNPNQLKDVNQEVIKWRYIFFSPELENYSNFEVEALNQIVYDAKKTQKLKKIIERDPSTIFDFLRFHFNSECNTQMSISSIINYITHFEEGYPSNKTYLKLIKLGYIYVQGRDKEFRPNVVLDMERYDTYYDKIVDADLFRSIFFVLEFVQRFMLKRGYVENWNFIINLNVKVLEQSKILKYRYLVYQLITKLQDMYPYRIWNIYVFRKTNDKLKSDISNSQLGSNADQSDLLRFDYELLNLFTDFLNSEKCARIFLVDKGLNSSIDNYIKQHHSNVSKISIVDFFNIFVNMNEVEEKFYGSKSNIKEFFEFVNSKSI